MLCHAGLLCGGAALEAPSHNEGCNGGHINRSAQDVPQAADRHASHRTAAALLWSDHDTYLTPGETTLGVNVLSGHVHKGARVTICGLWKPLATPSAGPKPERVHSRRWRARPARPGWGLCATLIYNTGQKSRWLAARIRLESMRMSYCFMYCALPLGA